MNYTAVDLIINPDNVIVEGLVVPRPSRMSPSQWLRFWECFDRSSLASFHYNRGLRDGQHDTDTGRDS
jgi:hypothetical protein